MHGAERLDSQQVHVFAQVKKMMQFLGSKNGGPFLNRQPLALVIVILQMVSGTINGPEKWNSKMVLQKLARRGIEKLLREIVNSG